MKPRHLIASSIILGAFPALAYTLPIDNPDALLALIKQTSTEHHHNAIINDQLIGHDFEFDKEGSDYQKLLAHIESGDERWLDVADALGCCVDAAAAEELDMAKAKAFTNAPEAVLRREHFVSLDFMCDVPLIEPTKAEYEEYLRAVKAAIQRIHDPSLRDKKMECSKIANTSHWEG